MKLILSIKQRNKSVKNKQFIVGGFSTRSPERFNLIALSITQVTHMDYEKGIDYITYIDVMNDSNILDLKPYTSRVDRVEKPSIPE